MNRTLILIALTLAAFGSNAATAPSGTPADTAAIASAQPQQAAPGPLSRTRPSCLMRSAC